MKLKQLNKQMLFLYLFFAIVGRIIPHPANVTPFTNICLWSGQKFSKWLALLTVIVGLIVSDSLLALIYHYPVFSSWTFFTYSGFAIITFISTKVSLNKSQNLLIFLFSSSVGFWLWTNFGSWLYMPIYPKTLHGLLYCYTFALPFLRNQLLGDAIWLGVIAISQRCFILKRDPIKI